jgi:two-component system phosphate regulon sensor histidine kinase PhoR
MNPSLRHAVFPALYTALLASLLGAVALFVPGSSGNNTITFAATVFVIVFTAAFIFIRYQLIKQHTRTLQALYDSVFDIVARVKGAGAVPRKVNDRRLHEEIIRLVNELENIDKAEIVHLKELEAYRKDFLGNVSHELKTPIFTIQGYVHTLLEGGLDDRDVNLLYLQKASKSIDRLISIVDDLESISRLEAGELILDQRTFDIRELITEVIESLELRAKEFEITLATDPESAVPVYVYADKDRIRQVLINLLVNSIKYGRKGGKTTVSVDDQERYCTVDVKDNGLGIEKQHLGRLFERFYRVDKSRSREMGGTGLGLAIVKHIIEAHRQKISVDSTFGEGTTFTFTLQKSR